ncbi:hypothetical protein LKV13_01310 [Borrelia sp. BU AG58]|uniref:hypothetical protein n=1 Tax=Borrelia sp. BU AG58 TaxID=2887345 RepID=UPI001E62F82E|nr:hypothetical protein [Borrelia sp. BU AG58]UER67451.1 hypothetical protein LKV13_01310 [Borrelia sp. BU AG58]
MELLKGFLAIRLSDEEYFPVLGLGDVSVKKVVLGKLLDETNVKLDLYVSEFEDFPNPVLLGSFFLDNLARESSDIDVYFKVDSGMLYVYGECGGVESRSRFDLSLLNLGVDSGRFGGSQIKKKPASGSGDLKPEDESAESLGVDFSENDFSPDSVGNLLDEKELYSFDETRLVNEGETDVSNSFGALDFSSDFILEEVDTNPKRDIFESGDNVGESLHRVNGGGNLVGDAIGLSDLSSEGSNDDVIFDSDNDVVKFVEDEDIDFSSVDVVGYKDSYFDDLSVNDIIADIDKGLGESSVGDVFLDSNKVFDADIESNQLNADSRMEGFVQTFMLYLSLISLFLLTFFSLFLIFSKVLNPRNLEISYHCTREEEKIEKYERIDSV